MLLVILPSNPSRLAGQRGAGNRGELLQLEDQMLRDFSVNFAILKKKKIKKLQRKVKFALLAYILQDDFGSLLVKLKLLECCFSLISPPKSLKELIKEQASWNLTQLPHLCFCTGGEDGDPRAW